MNKPILISTFAPWLPHQRSNASDDLLQRFLEEKGEECLYLRQLPVDPLLAPRLVLETFERSRPRFLVCCGMAETRSRLSLESQAVLEGNALKTDLDLAGLTAGLERSEISHDAGQFVCNTLYYRCLEHLRNAGGDHHVLFIHVPVLTPENVQPLTNDFTQIIARLAALSPKPSSR